jgi:hypothetical protein
MHAQKLKFTKKGIPFQFKNVAKYASSIAITSVQNQSSASRAASSSSDSSLSLLQRLIFFTIRINAIMKDQIITFFEQRTTAAIVIHSQIDKFRQLQKKIYLVED